jgi:hypothetical protein
MAVIVSSGSALVQPVSKLTDVSEEHNASIFIVQPEDEWSMSLRNFGKFLP